MGTYKINSWPSIVGGTLAALGASALLISDGVKHGFALEHALAPLCIGLTVLAGHMIGQALKEGKLLSVLGLALVACVGSGLVVYQSMGRQAASRDAQTVVAADQMRTREAMQADLAHSKAMLAEAQRMVAAECASGAGKACKGKQVSVQVYQNAIKGIEADLAKTPPVAVDPRADRIAGVATILGASMGADAIKALVALFEPFALPLFLELSSIFMFGFGIRHVHVDAPAPVKQAIIEEAELPPDSELEKLRKLLQLIQEPVKNKDLAAKAGVSESEMSKWVLKGIDAGIVSKVRAGKGVAITLH